MSVEYASLNSGKQSTHFMRFKLAYIIHRHHEVRITFTWSLCGNKEIERSELYQQAEVFGRFKQENIRERLIYQLLTDISAIIIIIIIIFPQRERKTFSEAGTIFRNCTRRCETKTISTIQCYQVIDLSQCKW